LRHAGGRLRQDRRVLRALVHALRDDFEGPRCDDELWLPSDSAHLAHARAFADSAAERFGFDEDERYQFKLAASEAVANAIEHGEPFANGRLRLRVRTSIGRLVFSVEDRGNFKEPGLPADPVTERGRGLMLIALMVDEVDISRSDDRTVVTIAKGRPSGAKDTHVAA
jgi:anti-sigma regulatory factor (Ser/Thr protein kinase)